MKNHLKIDKLGSFTYCKNIFGGKNRGMKISNATKYRYGNRFFMDLHQPVAILLSFHINIPKNSGIFLPNTVT